MNEREALLRAVCENPEEDTPRLVFADWLQENGEEARAEFIRLQVRFAALHRAALPGGEVIRKQERAIWAEHQAAFRSELPEISGLAWFPEFHRGFVERATISSDAQLVRRADAIFNNVPVQHLTVNRFSAVDGFAELTYLRHLKTLSLGSPRVGDGDVLVRRLLKCDQFNDSMLLFIGFGATNPELKAELRAKFGSRIR